MRNGLFNRERRRTGSPASLGGIKESVVKKEVHFATGYCWQREGERERERERSSLAAAFQPRLFQASGPDDYVISANETPNVIGSASREQVVDNSVYHNR